jgi:hypothetical protein
MYSLAPVLNVTANPVSIVYGESAPALSYSVTGLVDGDTSATALTGALARNSGALSGSGHEVVGSYSIGQGSVADALGYKLTFTSDSYTITPRSLDITATAQSKIYDGTTAASVTLSNNHIPGDVLTVSYVDASYADRNVGAGKLVSVSGVSLLGSDAGNYLLQAPVTTTADITFRTPDGYPGALVSLAQMEGQCHLQRGHCEASLSDQLPVAIADSGLRLPAGVPMTFAY